MAARLLQILLAAVAALLLAGAEHALADKRVECRGYLPNVTECSASDDDAYSGAELGAFAGCVPLRHVERGLNVSFDGFGSHPNHLAVKVTNDALEGAPKANESGASLLALYVASPKRNATTNATVPGEYECTASGMVKALATRVCGNATNATAAARKFWSKPELSAVPNGVCFKVSAPASKKENATGHTHWVLVNVTEQTTKPHGNESKSTTVWAGSADVYPTAQCDAQTRIANLSFHFEAGKCSPVGVTMNFTGPSAWSSEGAWSVAPFGKLGACLNHTVVTTEANASNATTTTTMMCKITDEAEGSKAFDWVLFTLIIGLVLLAALIVVGITVTRRRRAEAESARYGALLPSQDPPPTSYHAISPEPASNTRGRS